VVVIYIKKPIGDIFIGSRIIQILESERGVSYISFELNDPPPHPDFFLIELSDRYSIKKADFESL